MARTGNSAYREDWYEARLEEAATPKEQFDVLRGRLAASAKKLPDELQHGAYANAVGALKGVIEAIEDALEDVRPVGA
jgi:DNA repair exonuclease SbcCD ATPase subunit